MARSPQLEKQQNNGQWSVLGNHADTNITDCIEDFGAHTNYTELALRELGHRNVFPHSGAATEINVRGHRVFPLVTGTFGVVDFLHSGKLSTACILGIQSVISLLTVCSPWGSSG